MSGLTPEDKRLLNELHDAGIPDAADRVRVREALARRLAPATLTAPNRTPSPPERAANPPSTPLGAWGLKALVGMAIVAAIGGSWFVRAHATDAPPAEQTAGAASEPEHPSVAPPETESPAPHAPIAVPSGAAESMPAAPKAAPRPISKSLEDPSLPTVAEEVAVLMRAHDALRAGNAADALRALDEHARRFPNGTLAEERSAERVLALCAAGREAEARGEGERFLRRRPKSFFADRVRASCAGNPVARETTP